MSLATAAAGAPDAPPYARHPLHDPARAWPESNCYTDLWIALLHARGFDPVAGFAFTACVDWDGDQWTFFKPPAADLDVLYGVDVRELALWRDLEAHLVEHTARGRVALVEVDAHFLPDTAGTTYRAAHGKTTIGIDRVDVRARRLTYFHNAGHFALAGDDYDGVLGAGPHARPGALPPYAELAVFVRPPIVDAAIVRATAAGLLARHARRLPAENPVRRYAEPLARDAAGLAALGPADGPAAFHRYAFATLRQCGAAWGLAAAFVRWLGGPTAAAAEPFDALADTARAVQLRLARAAHTGRPAALAEPMAAMAARWDEAAAVLRAYADAEADADADADANAGADTAA